MSASDFIHEALMRIDRLRVDPPSRFWAGKRHLAKQVGGALNDVEASLRAALQSIASDEEEPGALSSDRSSP